MKKFFFILLSAVLFSVSSCSVSPKENSGAIKIVSWNVQNVFDDVEDGTEYDEYKQSGHWSSSLFRLRLDSIDKVFSYSELADSDVVVLNEVENENVVKEILELKSFSKRNFIYYVCAGEENGSINTAVVSRYPINEVKLHSVEKCRPIIEVHLDFGSGIVLFACHGKSRKEGVEQTSDLRLELGRAVAFAYEKSAIENPEKTFIIAGDFNEDWTDENIFTRDSYGSPLGISGRIQFGVWYCFWLDETKAFPCPGSYCFNNNWSCFDNILVMGTGVEDCSVVNTGILKKSDGTPNAWIRNTANGVSDHFPVYVVIRD